mmetsp:Transcript_16540/g.32875  ORF Transcript_16540/g.32875 Transcript_16540/m.32875 type:complete len:303 (-) Transcript_16540:7-915(-)
MLTGRDNSIPKRYGNDNNSNKMLTPSPQNPPNAKPTFNRIIYPPPSINPHNLFEISYEELLTGSMQNLCASCLNGIVTIPCSIWFFFLLSVVVFPPPPPSSSSNSHFIPVTDAYMDSVDLTRGTSAILAATSSSMVPVPSQASSAAVRYAAAASAEASRSPVSSISARVPSASSRSAAAVDERASRLRAASSARSHRILPTVASSTRSTTAFDRRSDDSDADGRPSESSRPMCLRVAISSSWSAPSEPYSDVRSCMISTTDSQLRSLCSSFFAFESKESSWNLFTIFYSFCFVNGARGYSAF